MALSLTDVKARIDRSLKLLGKQTDDVKTDNISDAVSKFISKMDLPIHGSNLSVTSGVKTYSIPSDIKKIQDIRDGDGDSVNFARDKTTGEITLQNTPGADATYVVYGTYRDVKTNLATIVAAILTDYEVILWAYVVAMCYDWANEDTAATKLQKADFLALEERRSGNVELSMDFVTVKTKDTTGQNIADAANAEGFNVGIDGLYQDDI